MSLSLPRIVPGCDACRRLHKNASGFRGDAADAKRKLIQADRYAADHDGVDLAAYADRARTTTRRANDAEVEYLAHHADAHPFDEPDPVAQAAPPVDDGLPILQTIFRYDPWRDDALCAQTDPEAFFPEKGGSTRLARAICARCPVQAECIDEALANNERFGIWGGFSERERRKILRRTHAAQATPAPQHHHLDNQQESA